MRYLSKNHRHPVASSCRLMGLSRSSYYYIQEKEPERHKRQEELESEIQRIFNESKGRYGSPRVFAELIDLGWKLGENRVTEVMKNLGLKASQKSSYRPRTTVSDLSSKFSERIFKSNETETSRENEVWCSDLTYLPLPYAAGLFMYLVTCIDIHTREIKSWSLSRDMGAEHTHAAIAGAIKNSEIEELKQLVFHSDRGSQYTSKKTRGLIETMEFTQSMSRKGNCYDNAFAESFFATLKKELDWSHCKSDEQMEVEIEEYINWYNKKRRHSSLGYLSPVNYKKLELAKAA